MTDYYEDGVSVETMRHRPDGGCGYVISVSHAAVQQDDTWGVWQVKIANLLRPQGLMPTTTWHTSHDRVSGLWRIWGDALPIDPAVQAEAPAPAIREIDRLREKARAVVAEYDHRKWERDRSPAIEELKKELKKELEK